jgi:diguanylate cyclase (GGDEF)-like protein
LQSTKNITPESLPGAAASEKPKKHIYHFALHQSEVNLDFYLEQFFRDKDITIHYFYSFEQLITIYQRFPLDIIFLASRADLIQEIEILRAIKQNVFLSIVPVIMVHPNPPDNDVVAAFENGVEEFIHGEWVGRLVKVRIKRVIDRSHRDLAINPSTKLPGPAIIEAEINRQINMKNRFAVCYADLDNFKAFNDYYGYNEGDKVIRLTARITKDIVFDLCRGGFVGHIAGDDFIFVIPENLIDQTCSAVIKTFDQLIPFWYEEKDRKKGSITTVNRRGEVEKFPILTMSIAVLINKNGEFKHVGEMSKMLADLKKVTKSKGGSNYMVERRHKY